MNRTKTGDLLAVVEAAAISSLERQWVAHAVPGDSNKPIADELGPEECITTLKRAKAGGKA